MSRTQIDRLGERLEKAEPSEADLRQLDEYRRSFGNASKAVVQRIQEALGLSPTARPAKSTASIVEKLRRETIRLTQIQDIAGCRIVVADTAEQDNARTILERVFPGAMIVDRRSRPSFGYRAIHVIARIDELPVEIQLRTLLQHQWAEFSEKLADRYGSELKYGGGPSEAKRILERFSGLIAGFERNESEMSAILTRVEEKGDVPGDFRRAIAKLRAELRTQGDDIVAFLREALVKL